MNLLRPILIAIALLLAVVAPASAQDFQRGFEAYQRGDFPAAFREWILLAEAGDARAQHSIGTLYADGKGVPKSGTKAVYYYRKAAEQGSKAAIFSLGFSYWEGIGVPKDLTSSYMWFNLSAAQGLDLAATFRGNVAEQMTREQIAEAQRLSRECLARNYKGC